MRRIVQFGGSLFLAAALIAPVAITGCSYAPDVYDAAHGDHHKWNKHEESVYRGYLADNHQAYRPFQKMSPDEQRSYWYWRHNHPEK